MSVKVMSWVWDHSKAKGNDRLTLLAIADSADHDGSNAWPSMVTLCRKTGLSESTVHRCINRLVRLGELRVERQRGGPPGVRPEARPNAYTILMNGPGPVDKPVGEPVDRPPGGPVDNSGGGVKLTPGGCQIGTGGGVTVTPNPSITRPIHKARCARSGNRMSAACNRGDHRDCAFGASWCSCALHLAERR